MGINPHAEQLADPRVALRALIAGLLLHAQRERRLTWRQARATCAIGHHSQVSARQLVSRIDLTMIRAATCSKGGPAYRLAEAEELAMGCLRRMRELGMGRPCGAREIEDARAVARCTGNTGAWNAAADEAIATSAAARMAHLVAAIRSWESPVCNFFDTDQFKFK